MEKNVLLSVNDLSVQFSVRGRILTAIRGISLDIYEHESIAIVGESGSGKSVFTKTFAGMLDSNGYVSNGSILFNDEELAKCTLPNDASAKAEIAAIRAKLDESAKLCGGAETWKKIKALKAEYQAHFLPDAEKAKEAEAAIAELTHNRVQLYNRLQTMDSSKEKAEIRKAKQELSAMDKNLKAMKEALQKEEKAAKAAAKADTAYISEYRANLAALEKEYAGETSQPASDAAKAENELIAKEIYLSCGRYSGRTKSKLKRQLIAAVTEAMREGAALQRDSIKNEIFDKAVFRVAYRGEDEKSIWGRCIVNLANVKYGEDWTQIRGSKIATVFQDPMTSLNPLLTIGHQISSIIIKHQGVSEAEARHQALEMMAKVGIPNPEKRYDDYPFQYSGGMRQRIVIAIALSCRPKILICDEPTTALDVTIQAQILQLIKDLQKEFGYTIVFITHDLGVVANVADRVAVLYAGQIVELGTAEEVFYDPRHPYTWALLSSLPQLADRGQKLYSITGTPPSLYNEIKGDAFAPRNPYCMKVDTLAEPPMFKVTDTHYAKTWLLHPDAPAVEKPEVIRDIHSKLIQGLNL